MAVYQQSPGIQIIEKNVSSSVVGQSSTVGATVGAFQWGSVMTPQLIDSEASLITAYGTPDSTTYPYFFAVANFLAYTNAMWVVRAKTTNLNATAIGTGLSIDNYQVYEDGFSTGQGAVGEFAARYPGTMGNSIKVSIADSATYAAWEYKDQFTVAPGTSEYAASKGGSNDELHVIVIDSLGKFTGTPGSTLEKYSFVSKASDAVSYQGLANYYVNAITNKSQYIYWMDHNVSGTNWGTPVAGVTFTSLVDTVTTGYDFTYQLAGGTDDNTPTDGEIELGWDLLADVQTYDISLLITGNASPSLAAYIVTNIADVRTDCVAFCSITTESGPIWGTSVTKIADAKAFKTFDSTYAVIDSGYKYMYDKYNDKYRWIALNADIAGLCARVDATQDTWFSPAGMTKGQIKGAIKLAWNPSKAERDAIYPAAINPVITQVGQGTMLFGDRTATLKPSAFDRINVRRLFLILEKTIALSAKYRLFEINDAVTRNSFVASVEPFLRDVQSRRGIDAFKVICDNTNNTSSVIAGNEFRGTVLVKPLYSINYITLTFVAVGPEVSFDFAATA